MTEYVDLAFWHFNDGVSPLNFAFYLTLTSALISHLSLSVFFIISPSTPTYHSCHLCLK